MGLNTLGIIDAGQMGAGIAQVAAQSGLNIVPVSSQQGGEKRLFLQSID